MSTEKQYQECETKDCTNKVEGYMRSKYGNPPTMYFEEYCDECHEHHYCECGNKLEDAYGTPGDGFCIMCR